MRPLYTFLDWIKAVVRGWMVHVARGLNNLTGGKLSPDVITYTSFLAHVPIAVLIAQQRYAWAGILLIIFGLFDALDGALAREQKRADHKGMLLDSVTDRAKEAMLYTGAAYSFVGLGRPYMAAWAVAACGLSLLVSYINAWGEAIVDSKDSKTSVNQKFRGGVARFEVRIFLLVIGLLSGRLILATIIVAILAGLTALERFILVRQKA